MRRRQSCTLPSDDEKAGSTLGGLTPPTRRLRLGDRPGVREQPSNPLGVGGRSKSAGEGHVEGDRRAPKRGGDAFALAKGFDSAETCADDDAVTHEPLECGDVLIERVKGDIRVNAGHLEHETCATAREM